MRLKIANRVPEKYFPLGRMSRRAWFALRLKGAASQLKTEVSEITIS